MKKLNKKEIAWLEKIEDSQPDPWATMASNAILFDNRETLRDLKKLFKQPRGRIR